MPRRRKRDDVDGLWPPDAKPSWQDYFSDEELAALKKTLEIRSKKKSEYFRAVLPLLIVRYQRARTGEVGNSLKVRRQRLKSIANQAEKLRMSLRALEGPTRLDFLAEASHKTGSAFSIDAMRPDQWLSDRVDQVIRDVLISARSAEKSLKKISVRGGSRSGAISSIRRRCRRSSTTVRPSSFRSRPSSGPTMWNSATG